MPYDPSKPYTVESAAPKYDPTKPYTVESAAPEVAQNVPAEVPTRPSITSLLDQAGRDNRTITTPDASSAFVPAPDTKPTTVTQDNPVAHDDPIARAFRTVVKPDFTIEQSTEAAVKLLDQDRDGFEPAEYMKANPGANPLFAKIVLEVYKARSREGLIATRVLTKAPEVAFGYGAEGYGMLGSIASGIKGQFKNWAKVASPIPLPEGERALAAKKIFAATMLASGGLVDQARTGIRKIGENSFTGIVPRAINWAVTPGADAKDIISGYGGPSTDAGWQARLNSDVKMLHRMEAAATGQNLPGGPFTAEQTAEVKDMSAADPFTFALTAGAGKAAGLVGKGVALADAASTLRRVASPSLLTRAISVAKTPVVKTALTAGALTALSEKDEQAAAMAGLGAAGVAVSGLSTGKQNLPILVEGVNMLGDVADLTSKVSSNSGKITSSGAPLAGAMLGAAVNTVIPGGLVGTIIQSAVGAKLGSVLAPFLESAGRGVGKLTGEASDKLRIAASRLEQATTGEVSRPYILPESEIIRNNPELKPLVAIYKESTLRPIFGSTAVVHGDLLNAIVYEQPVSINKKLQPLAPPSFIPDSLKSLFTIEDEKVTEARNSARSIQRTAEYQSGPLKQPNNAYSPLSLEKNAAGVPVLRAHGTKFVNDVVRHIFSDPEILKEFAANIGPDGKPLSLLSPDGTKLSAAGAEHVLNMFDEANRMQVRDFSTSVVNPDGTTTTTYSRKWKSGKEALEKYEAHLNELRTVVDEVIPKDRADFAKNSAAKAAEFESKFSKFDKDMADVKSSTPNLSDIDSAASGLIAEIKQAEIGLSKEIPGGILTPEVLSARESFRSVIADNTTKLTDLKKAAEVRTAEFGKAKSSKLESFQIEMDKLAAEEAESLSKRSLSEAELTVHENALKAELDTYLNSEDYKKAKVLARLGILGIEPESIPLDSIDQVRNLPSGRGIPPRIKLPIDETAI